MESTNGSSDAFCTQDLRFRMLQHVLNYCVAAYSVLDVVVEDILRDVDERDDEGCTEMIHREERSLVCRRDLKKLFLLWKRRRRSMSINNMIKQDKIFHWI